MKFEPLTAIRATPRRIVDAWIDPTRRLHSISRILESYIPAALVLLTVGTGWKAFGWATLIVAGEFLLYEWLLEPFGFAGYYWERGPKENEIFIRG